MVLMFLEYIKWKPQSSANISSTRITIADATNFDSIVTNSGRDAFIFFYKPTCQHCIRVAPVWDEFGEMMKNEAIDIIKMDAIANECPRPYVVNSYPTFYLKFANIMTSPVKYTGERSLNGFIKYVSKNATQELAGWDRKGKPKKLK